MREATRPQIANEGTRESRPAGKLFGSYGYLTWTDNEIVKHSYWLSGVGGQRIGISSRNFVGAIRGQISNWRNAVR